MGSRIRSPPHVIGAPRTTTCSGAGSASGAALMDVLSDGSADNLESGDGLRVPVWCDRLEPGAHWSLPYLRGLFDPSFYFHHAGVGFTPPGHGCAPSSSAVVFWWAPCWEPCLCVALGSLVWCGALYCASASASFVVFCVSLAGCTADWDENPGHMAGVELAFLVL